MMREKALRGCFSCDVVNVPHGRRMSVTDKEEPRAKSRVIYHLLTLSDRNHEGS